MVLPKLKVLKKLLFTKLNGTDLNKKIVKKHYLRLSEEGTSRNLKESVNENHIIQANLGSYKLHLSGKWMVSLKIMH